MVADKKLWLARGVVNSEVLQGNGSASLVGSSKVSPSVIGCCLD